MSDSTRPSTRHVFAISGGKDSTCLALRFREIYPDIDADYVITPTGNELPEMIDHWNKLQDILGKRFNIATNGMTLKYLINHYKSLPSHRMRWCTRQLKLEPYYQWIAERTPAISYVGLRADEDGRYGMSFPETVGVQVKFPLREWGWGLGDVLSYLDSKGIKIPARTDCAWCYDQTLGEFYRLWHDHPEIYRDGEKMEQMVSLHRGAEFTFRSPSRDNWPASMAAMRAEFEKGRVPRGTVRIDDMFLGGMRRCRACTL